MEDKTELVQVKLGTKSTNDNQALRHYTVTLRDLISLDTGLFDQKLIQANNKENIEALHNWPGESGSGFSLTKGQKCIGPRDLSNEKVERTDRLSLFVYAILRKKISVGPTRL